MIVNPLVENLGINDLSDSIVTISDNKYKFKAILFNTDGDMVKINYSAISELRIIDRIASFNCEGHIVFNNDLNALESFDSFGPTFNGEPSKNFNSYSFRGDGRDFLMLSIQPFIDTDEPPSDRSAIALNYLFSVYDYEELTYNNNTKQKKLYLTDYVHFLLKEKNSYFSTGKYSKGVSNEERSMYTGDAIKALLESVFNDYGIKIKTSRWDRGDTKIFYSSPAQFKAIDDLYYLLDNHVSDSSNQNSPALLTRHNDIWSLIPVVDLFKNAYNPTNNTSGPGLTEQFIIGKMTADDTTPGNKPIRSSTSLFSLDLPDYTLVDNFQFSDPSPTDVMNCMNTHIVHNYNVSSKVFSVDLEQNNLQKNLNIFKQNFVNLQKGSTGRAPFNNIPTNQSYLAQKNVINVFNPNRNSLSRLNSGRNNFLMSSILLNSSISFKCRGNVIRSTGTFFSVSRGDNYPDNKFDNKMIGTYMSTVVEHIFEKGSYNNNLYGVKTYYFDKSSNGRDSI